MIQYFITQVDLKQFWMHGSDIYCIEMENW